MRYHLYRYLNNILSTNMINLIYMIFAGETVNNFINKNALEIIHELEESINESMAEIFIDLLNNIFSKLPTDFWLLTDEQYAKFEEASKSENKTT